MRPFRPAFRSVVLLCAALGASAAARPVLAGDPPKPAPAEGPRAQKQVEAPYIGLYTEPLALARCAELGLDPGTGLSLVNLLPGGPAAQAGLAKGDVLVKLDDQLLVNPAQLRVLVRTRKAGEPFTFGLLRDGKPETVKVVPIARSMPELTPGGEESLVMYGNQAGAVRTFRLAPGEQALPPEILKDMPQELREQLARAGDGAPQGVLRLNQASARVISRDGKHVFEVEHGRREHLRITDNDGKEIYDGPLPADDKEWEKVPADVRARAKGLSGQTIMRIKVTPQPQPAAPPTGK